jgi:hypothetical protein
MGLEEVVPQMLLVPLPTIAAVRKLAEEQLRKHEPQGVHITTRRPGGTWQVALRRPVRRRADNSTFLAYSAQVSQAKVYQVRLVLVEYDVPRTDITMINR